MQPPDPDGRQHAQLQRACRLGQQPAELLHPRDRQELVYDLWLAHWTDAEIATHTRMSTYTAARIRNRMGLPARPLHQAGEVAS